MPRRPWITVLAVLVLGATPAPSRADEDPWAARPVEDWVTSLGATAAPLRIAAARALFRVAPSHPEVEAPLRRALDDPEAQVRLAAIQALLRLPATDAEALRLAAQDSAPRVAWTAARALAERGDASAAAPALARLVAAPDPWIADGARAWLRRLGPDALPALLAEPGAARFAVAAEILARLDAAPATVVDAAAGSGGLAEWATSALETHAVAAGAGVPAALRRLHPGDAPARADLEAAGPAAATATPTLRALLASREKAPLHAGAARVLRGLPGAIPSTEWEALLDYRGPAVAEEAAEALAADLAKRPEMWDRLVKVARSSGRLDGGAIRVLRAAGDAATPRVVAALREGGGPHPFGLVMLLARADPGAAAAFLAGAEDGQAGPWLRLWPSLLLLHIDPARSDVRRAVGWDLRNWPGPAQDWFLDRLGRLREPQDPLLGGLLAVVRGEDLDDLVRRDAVALLAEFAPRSPVALRRLVAAAEAPRASVAADARRALAALDASAWAGLAAPATAPSEPSRTDAEALDPELVAPTPAARCRALQRLVGHARDLPDAHIRAVAFLLSDPDADVRRLAARTLDALDVGLHVEPALLAALSDPDLEVRRRAASSLRLAGGSSGASLPLLIDALRDVDAALERQLDRSGARKDPRLFHLERRYRDAAGGLRWELLMRLALHGPDAAPALPLLGPLVQDARTRDPAIASLLRLGPAGRLEIARALAVGSPETVSAIAVALKQEDLLTEAEALWLADAAIRHDRTDASWACFRAMTKHRAWSEGAVRTLAQMMEREPSRVEDALDMLGRSGSPAAATVLAERLGAEEAGRPRVLAALARLGPAALPALPALRERLSASRQPESGAIVTAIRSMGPGAKAAVPDLLELLGGSSGVDHNHVVAAVADILPEKERRVTLEAWLLDPDPARRDVARSVSLRRSDAADYRLVLEWLEADPSANRSPGFGPRLPLPR